MMRFGKFLFASSLLVGCVAETSSVDQHVEITKDGCVKIEGSELGRLLTLDIPDGDGGTIAVTITGWTLKDGTRNEYVGFTLDTDATFTVKAGQSTFTVNSDDEFLNPNGTSGSAAKGISNIAFCDADDDEPPPPPPPDCDHNDDGDTTDHGECDYVPPPPPPDCDHNDDGDTTDHGECDYVPPPPPPDCDHNDDGDTTDHDECDYVPPPPPPDCDHNDDGDSTDEGECNHVPDDHDCPNA